MEPDLMGDQELGERLLLQGEGDSHPNHPTLTQVGEKQPHQYRDVWAAVLFGGGQCVIFYLGCFWGLPNLQYTASNTTDTTETIRFSGLLYISLLSGLAAVLLSGGALAILVRMAHQLIEMSIYFSIFTCSVTTVFLFATGMLTMGCASLLVLVFTVVYAWSVWRRIPFATANLQTAVAAIQNNQGLILTGYVVSMVVTLLNMIWVLAYVGVYVRSASCSDNECTSHTHPMVVTSMLLMFFWSTEVAKNILHVTVSGVVGTFWFAPEEASGFFSPAVTDSLTRACTFSLGSVCLGSLLTAILQVLHQLANQARLRGRGNDLLLCVLECLVGFLERLIAYFNKWAYVYIGLYGYDYLTAGKRVMTLFSERGWTVIINDSMILRVLNLVSLMIAAMTGCIGVLLANANHGWISEFGASANATAFFVPFVVGLAVASILMNVIASAVDTVVVAFAEAPLEFERNHPGLSAQMVSAWRQCYPDEFGR